MKKFTLISLLCIIALSSWSQGNRQLRTVGIRGGFSSGFEYRAYAHDQLSYKLLLSTRNRGVQLTGLKEFHQPGLLDFSDQVTFIYGFGAHIGFESWNAYDPDYIGPQPSYYYYQRRTSPVIGLDGLGAFEYTFRDVPISLGFEAKPYFNLFGRNFFQLHPFDFAFTLKYIF